MKVKEKINHFLKSVGSSQPQLAEALGLNYQRMNKNIAAGKITADVILGLATLYPTLDMNWLLRDNSTNMVGEPTINYEIEKKPEDYIKEIRALLDNLQEDLAQK